MDNLINADMRATGCYWVPIMAYFENDRPGRLLFLLQDYLLTALDLHNSLRPSQVRGRRVFTLLLLCSPTHSVFDILSRIPAAERSQTTRDSKVDTKYAMTTVDADSAMLCTSSVGNRLSRPSVRFT